MYCGECLITLHGTVKTHWINEHKIERCSGGGSSKLTLMNQISNAQMRTRMGIAMLWRLEVVWSRFCNERWSMSGKVAGINSKTKTKEWKAAKNVRIVWRLHLFTNMTWESTSLNICFAVSFIIAVVKPTCIHTVSNRMESVVY